jgi:TonB family protein
MAISTVKLVFGLLIAPMLVPVCWAQDRDSSAWIENAAQKSNMRAGDVPAYDLQARVSVSVTSNAMMDGTYRLLWMSQDHWREEVHFPGYDRIRIGGSGMYWQRRTTPFEFMRVWQIDKILKNLNHLDLLPNEKIGKGHERKIGTEKMNCADISERGYNRFESCFDQTSGVLLQLSVSHPNDESLGGLTQIEYSDYQEQNGKAFPRSIHAVVGKTPVIEFHLETLSEVTNTPTGSFETLTEDTKWITCEKPDPVSILEQARPQYPPDARAQGQRGTVGIYVVIEATGEISHPKVVASVVPSLDAAALNTVSRWRYKPPTCHGVPYSLENMVFVTFMAGN